MHLVSMDIDRSSEFTNSHLGPFSPGLNAICGAQNTGKSALMAKMVESIFATNSSARLPYRETNSETYHGEAYQGAAYTGQYRNGRPSNSVYGTPYTHNFSVPASRTVSAERTVPVARTFPAGLGQVTWSDDRGLFRATRNHNEANNVVVEHRPGWSDAIAWRPVDATIADSLVGIDRESFEAVFATPNSEVVLTQSLWNAARRLGLLHAVEKRPSARFAALEAKRVQLEEELRNCEALRVHRETLLARKRYLESEIAKLRAAPQPQLGWTEARLRIEEQIRLVALELDRLRAKEEQLVREANRLGEAIAGLDIAEPAQDYRRTLIAPHSQRLMEIEAQLQRWRRTLREIHGHREQLQHTAADLKIDRQLDLSNPNIAADPREPLRALENQILNTRRHLEQVLDLYTYEDRTTNALDRSLPSTLRAMQEDLYEVCRQLSRRESDNASKQLSSQIGQLERCEAELNRAIDKLIEDRAKILAEIASEHKLPLDQLTMTFGDQCRCDGHTHTLDWMLAQTGPQTVLPREDNSERRRLLQKELEDVLNQLAHCRAEIQRLVADKGRLELELDSIKAPRLPELDWPQIERLSRELEGVVAELAREDRSPRVLEQLNEVRRELKSVSPYDVEVQDSLYQSAEHWLDRLSGGKYRVLPAWAQDTIRPNNLYSHNRYSTDPYSVNVPAVANSPVYSSSIAPSEEVALVHLAIRAAIVSAYRVGRNPIPLLIDDALRSVGASTWRWTVSALADLARDGQQVILLTSSDEVASLVRGHQGWVCYLRSPRVIDEPVYAVQRPVRPAPVYVPDSSEINRRLTAFANEGEREGWPETETYWRKRPAAELPPMAKPTPRGQYFLSEGSLVEDAPSMTPELAARVRSHGIDRVGDLLRVEPSWLAANLRMQGVTPEVVARWQNEARMVCEVPQLRPFDARILVGCGVTSSTQLAQIHPGKLAQRVQEFLATDRGRDILRSGSSYELSRITSWIASANRSIARPDRSASTTKSIPARTPRMVIRGDEVDYIPSHSNADRVHREALDRNAIERNALERERIRRRRERMARDTDRNAQREMDRRADRPQRSNGDRASGHSGSGATGNGASGHTSNGSGRSAKRDSARNSADRSGSAHAGPGHAENRATVKMKPAKSLQPGWRFYLELESSIESAPSIGNRLAEKLESVGIRTVNDLLQADAESLASRLGNRKVNGDVVRSWQNQASLVCRVPNLRGHDAQLLVMAGVNSPERLAKSVAGNLLDEVRVVSRTTEGQRILRGSKEPDLAEVNDWIQWAGHCRALRAA